MQDGGGAESDVRWETYPSGARLMRMKVESFRRLAIRKGWRRTHGNDGLARVAIPVAEVERREAHHPHGDGEADAGDATPGARGGGAAAEPRAISALADALRMERERREAAEEAARQAAEAVARAEGVVEGLQEAVRVAEAAAQRKDDGRREATARVAALQAGWDATRAQEQVQRDVAVRQAAELAAAREQATAAEAEAKGLREALAEARRPFWRRWFGG